MTRPPAEVGEAEIEITKGASEADRAEVDTRAEGRRNLLNRRDGSLNPVQLTV